MFLSLILFRRTKLVNLIFLLSILHGTFAFSEAVIEVIKRGQPQLPIAGEVFSYSFTLRNIGDEIAENLLFSDTLPAGFHYQQSETPCSVTSTNPDVVECRAAGNAFTAPQYQLAVGEIVTFELLVSIEPQIIGVVSNQATVTLDNATYSVNSFPDDITVQSVSDLKVQKFASKIRAKAGQQFDYLMVVENNGPSTAFHPVIRDTLFMQTVSNAQWVRANGCSLSVRDCGGLTQEFQCNFALATGVFDLATIGATTLHPTGYYDCDGDLPGDPGYEPTVNGRIVMTINLQAYEDGALNNIVEVFAGDNISTDPNPENNIATTVTPFDASSDLQVTKIISSDPGQPWIAGASQVIYQVTVTNLGISRAENVVLKDFLPKGVSIVDISVLNGDTGSCLSGTPGNPEDPILCKLGTLTPTGHPEEGEGDTATKTVEITINVDSDFPIDAKTCGSILNNSAWASSDSMDLDNSNNAAFISALVEGSTADLKVTKFQTSSQEKAGDALTYKILVQNLGPCTARMVTLSDTGIADGNFTIESLNSDRAMSCSPMAPLNTEIQDFYFACTLDQPLEPVPQAPGGGAWTLTMEINADDGITLTNDATLTHMGIDPDLKNNEVLISGDVGALADLAVIKQAEGETDNIPGYDTNWLATQPLPHDVKAGLNLRYTLTVTNNGPSAAVNVLLVDRLPDLLSFVSAPQSTPAGVNCAIAEIENKVTCGIGTLLSEESVAITFIMKVSEDAQNLSILRNEAVVSSDTMDLNNENNYSTSLSRLIGGRTNNHNRGNQANAHAYVDLPPPLVPIVPAPAVVAAAEKAPSSEAARGALDLKQNGLAESAEKGLDSKSALQASGCSTTKGNALNLWMVLLLMGLAKYLNLRCKKLFL